MIWFGWVLWHINHCRLFNTKSFLYIYIKYIWFGLVGFSGISTIVGYSMPNPLNVYILSIHMNCKHILLITFLNEPELIFLHTVKWFQVLLCSSNNLTSIICFHTVCSIWPINRTLSGAITLHQSGPRSNATFSKFPRLQLQHPNG